MDLISAINIAITITIFFIGITILFSSHKKISNIIFFIICFFFSFWSITDFLTDIPKFSLDILLLLSKLTFVGPIIIPALFLYFSLIFPISRREINLVHRLFIFIIPAIFLVSLPTNLIIRKIFILEPSEIYLSLGWRTGFESGPLYPFLILYAIIFLTIALVILGKKFFELKGVYRSQLKYILIGFSLTIIFSVFFGSVLPVFFNIYIFSKLSLISIIFVIFTTALAITKYHLFNIKIILSEILIGIIAILLLIQTLTSKYTSSKIINGGIFILFCLFGYYLIRATIKEITLREEVDRLSKMKSEFLSIASHQLCTPLTAVKGYISMILEGTYGKVSEKQRKPLENVYASNERLIKLVNDLLNISRLEAGRVEFNFEPTSLLEMVEGVVNELKINAEKKGLYLRIVKPSQKLPQIMADKDKLRQAILNIVDNGIKYTQQGGIEIRLNLEDEKIKIAIADTGEGITQEEIDKLFEIFSRASAGMQTYTAGAGIGLYVAKKFVEAHGGRIWVKSPGKGKGSTFYIELPININNKIKI